METKTKSQHTAGPWKIDSTLGDIEADGKKAICKMYSLNWGAEQSGRTRAFPSLEAEANARLIAAAPDLLEVLKDLMFAYSHKHDRACKESCIWKDAESIIAKAEGK